MTKKISLTVILLSFLIIALTACGKDKGVKKEHNSRETTLGYHIHKDDNGETHIHYGTENNGNSDEKSNGSEKSVKSSSKKAKPLPNSQDAVEKIKKFSAEKLGLKGELSGYHFLVSTKEKTIKGKKYLEVVASKMNNREKDTVNIITKGTYYVSGDMKTVLKKDLKTGKITRLK